MRHRLVLVPLSALLLSSSPTTTADAAATGPTVASLSAASGPLVGGERVTLHGSGFGHVHQVLFGGAVAHGVHVVSSHVLTALVPKHKAATVNVRVVTSAGASASTKRNRFSYEPLPVVSAVTVSSGPTVGATRVVLRGQHFLHVRSVLFGTTKGLDLRVLSSTAMSVTTPTHLAGPVDLRVVTAFGTSVRRTADRFLFVAPTAPLPIPPASPAPPITPIPPAPPLPLPAITTTALPVATQGIRYAGTTFAATSGTPPYTWSAHGLPGGLAVSAAGVLSGTTRASAGVKALSVTVTDSAGRTAAVVVPLTVHAFGGQLYAWGDNTHGTVGDGTQTNAAVPVKVAGLPSVISVCETFADSLAVESDGTVWGWGDNSDGFLGSGDTTPAKPFKLAGMPLGVTTVVCGFDTGYVLTSAGTVYAWGRGSRGELGNGGKLSSDAPAQVANLDHVVALAAASSTAFAVRDDGTVRAWGEENNENLGDGSTTQALSPIVVPGLSGVVGIGTVDDDTWALRADGTVAGWGLQTEDELGDGQTSGSEPTPVTIAELRSTLQLVAGESTEYALQEDGTVLAWGSNGVGEVGNSTVTSPPAPAQVSSIVGVQALGSGNASGYALLGNGTVDAWGVNSSDQLGDGTTANRTTPVPVSGLKNVVGLGVTSEGNTGFAIEDQIASGTPIPPHL